MHVWLYGYMDVWMSYASSIDLHAATMTDCDGGGMDWKVSWSPEWRPFRNTFSSPLRTIEFAEVGH